MKKKMMIAGLIALSVLAYFVIYLISFSDDKLNAQSGANKQLSGKMLEELRKEQKQIEDERKRLQQYELNLKNFEAELDKRNNEYLLKEKELKRKEDIFNKKLEDTTVDRQTIETYESIDPEQAAILLKNLYIKDRKLTTLLMRKIGGKKAGKILEAMIPLDREISTQIAKQTLDYYKPE